MINSSSQSLLHATVSSKTLEGTLIKKTNVLFIIPDYLRSDLENHRAKINPNQPIPIAV